MSFDHHCHNQFVCFYFPGYPGINPTKTALNITFITFSISVTYKYNFINRHKQTKKLNIRFWRTICSRLTTIYTPIFRIGHTVCLYVNRTGLRAYTFGDVTNFGTLRCRIEVLRLIKSCKSENYYIQSRDMIYVRY